MCLEKKKKKPRKQNPCIQKTPVTGNHGPGTILASEDTKMKKTKSQLSPFIEKQTNQEIDVL